MPYRVSFRFKQIWDKTGGWGLGFWNSAANMNAARVAALGLAQTLYDCVGSSCQLNYARISSTATPRQASTIRFDGLTGYNPIGAEATQDMTPNVSLLLQLFSSDHTMKAEEELRGIPKNWLKQGGRFNGGGTYLANLKAALSLATSGWCLYGLKPDRSKATITGISATGVVSVSSPVSFASAVKVNGNPLVRLNRVRLGIKQRTFQVLVNPGPTFQLNLSAPFTTADIQTLPSSTAAAVEYQLMPIDSVEADTITTRQVGRPLDLSTGRRRTRAT